MFLYYLTHSACASNVCLPRPSVFPEPESVREVRELSLIQTLTPTCTTCRRQLLCFLPSSTKPSRCVLASSSFLTSLFVLCRLKPHGFLLFPHHRSPALPQHPFLISAAAGHPPPLYTAPNTSSTPCEAAGTPKADCRPPEAPRRQRPLPPAQPPFGERQESHC
jgi:hypothetical protein